MKQRVRIGLVGLSLFLLIFLLVLCHHVQG